jgi:hypothetical protein
LLRALETRDESGIRLEETLKMSRSMIKIAALPVVCAGIAALVLTGCGGGGGGGSGSNANGALINVSFVGYLPAPGVGTNPLASLPTVFRDQALEFTFDGPLDAGVHGGFAAQNGTLIEFSGVPGAGTLPVPYYAFIDQNGARNSLQIRENAPGGPSLASYIVGRHRDKLDTIVIDPRVLTGNPLGLPVNAGFKSNQEYVYIIPAVNGLYFGGGNIALPHGPSVFALPVMVPPFSTQPFLSGLFRSGISFGPDPIPPAVLSIVPQSMAAGTAASPIAEADPIIVTFSKPVTRASLDPLKNFIVRNLDFVNSTYPGGVIVPGSIDPLTPMATADSVFIYTPSSPYGPGVSPTEGYDIEVRIGDIPYPQPNAVVPPILGLPTGLSGTQLELSNSLSRIMRSTPCMGCQTPASVSEGFDNASFKDTTFIPPFGGGYVASPSLARWSDPTAPSQLAGRIISGSPAGNNPGALGTRMQFIVSPTPEGAGGLFSPFDASMANSGTQCAGIPTGCNLGINPNGGSHIMHIYEAVELGNFEESLEQIEWSSVSGVTNPTTYPQYQIWCGVSNIAAPLAGGAGAGLFSVFDQNYNLIPYQFNTPAAVPILPACNPTTTNPKKILCGGPTSYVVQLQTTTFYPYPLLNPCFDYSRDTGAGPGPMMNLLFEQNIEAGMQLPNFNRYRANNFTPVRRLIDAPLSLNPPTICPFNHGGTFDIYRARFTFVGLVAQGRSLWYDTGNANPNYLQFIVSPPHASQPAGTQSTWTLEGTDTLNPGPGTIGASAVYITANGTVNSAVLTVELLQKRYFRFKVELRSNNVTNASPSYTDVVMAYTIPPGP